MNKPSSFVKKIDLTLAGKLRHDLEEQGFAFSQPPYSMFSAKKKGVICTLYESGKLMVQGKEMASFIEYYLEPEILKDFSFTYRELNIDKTPRIGVDEAGKGDFFGPLCIASVFAGDDAILKLDQIGVCDSKRIADNKVLRMAQEIRKEFSHEIIRLFPEKYNKLYASFRNLNRLLAWGHATAIENLMERTQCQNVIIDQFASEHVVEDALKKKNLSPNLKQRHRAEEDTVVAAASILARAAFLEGLATLEKEHSAPLPKGASQKVIEAGKNIVNKYGDGILEKVGKLHFKTREDILSETLGGAL